MATSNTEFIAQREPEFSQTRTLVRYCSANSPVDHRQAIPQLPPGNSAAFGGQSRPWDAILFMFGSVCQEVPMQCLPFCWGYSIGCWSPPCHAPSPGHHSSSPHSGQALVQAHWLAAALIEGGQLAPSGIAEKVGRGKKANESHYKYLQKLYLIKDSG